MTHLPSIFDDTPMAHAERIGKSVRLWSVIAVALACVLYVGLAITPSSYGVAFGLLGLEPEGLLLGIPRGIRSDEWMVYTPYVQIAVANGLDTVNSHSPYHETLRSFQALPILDWGMLFKPYHWGFLFLPPANAYSLYFLSMSMAFLVGWSLFLRQLRAPAYASVLIATALYFSPFVQVWWTSNAGAFALAPWVTVAWLYFERRSLRIAASAYALAVWMLSCAYPPFLYSATFAMALLVLTFRRDKLSWSRLFDASVAGTLALAVFIGYFHALIDVMQNTIYPGRRESMGGGVEWAKLLAHFAPSITTHRYEPLDTFTNSNACEIAVLSTLFPLYAATLIKYDVFKLWVTKNQSSIMILISGLVFLGCWIFLPVSPAIGKITGLFMVPPSRALLGFGLLLNIASAVVLVRCGVTLSPIRLLILGFFTIAGSATKLVYAPNGTHGLFSWMDAVPYVCLLLLIAGARIVHHPFKRLHGVLLVALLGNIVSYGLFNPLQSAKPIFAMNKDRIEEFLKQSGAEQDADGTWVARGHFGALIAGAGIPAVNHVLYYPQFAYFRKHFPDMPEEEFNLVFNRYAHISVGDGSRPQIIGADHVEVPMAAMLGRAEKGGDLPIIEFVANKPAAINQSLPIGHVDTVGPWEGHSVALQGWVNARLDSGAKIRIWTSSQPASASLTIMARPDVATVVDPRLLNSGVRLTLSVQPEANQTELCILVEESTGSISTVRFPNGDTACTRLATQPLQ
ncbi:DUF7657 domain-containing protein [Stenotrophomonas pavanii]|uniref:DUF7657 domain-containing protein n=1 Tax=Stenotrophomonas pavanii TaxID=487698 RepID=UPI003F983CA9